MRKTREIVRLVFETRLSQRAVVRELGVSGSTVSDVLARLHVAGLAWPLPEGLPDAELERRLYRPAGERAPDPREPDWKTMHAELRRQRVTLQLLWRLCRPRHSSQSRKRVTPLPFSSSCSACQSGSGRAPAAGRGGGG